MILPNSDLPHSQVSDFGNTGAMSEPATGLTVKGMFAGTGGARGGTCCDVEVSGSDLFLHDNWHVKPEVSITLLLMNCD
jgi:hypothetical protein